VGFGETFQGAGRGAVFWVGGDSLLFSLTQFPQVGAAGAEAEFAVEPEGAGVDGFVVVLADLVGINRNTFRGGEGAETAQCLGVDPGGFSLAVGVEGVEADLDPLGTPFFRV
jgi:hypothetical protein